MVLDFEISCLYLAKQSMLWFSLLFYSYLATLFSFCSIACTRLTTLYILPVHIPSTIYKYGKKNARNIDYTFTCSQKDFQSCKDSSIIKINLGNNVTYNNCCFCAKFVGDHLIKTVGNILIWQHCATVWRMAKKM